MWAADKTSKPSAFAFQNQSIMEGLLSELTSADVVSLPKGNGIKPDDEICTPAVGAAIIVNGMPMLAK